MPEFSEFEEEQIVLLALESPDFFYRIVRFMKPEYFETDELQYIMHTYVEYYEKFDEVPTREVIKDIIYKELDADEESSKPVMNILDKSLDPRNSRYIRDQVVKWARIRQLSLIYDEEVMEQVQKGNWQVVDELIQQAAGISDVVIKPFRFFKDIDELFSEDEKEHYTTGFTRLDNTIHDGRGPARREVFLWVAPTGVGKCHTLESKIIEKKLSQIYAMELEDGTIRYCAGYRKVKTTRGMVMVCNLTEEDDIEELPDCDDKGDVYL